MYDCIAIGETLIDFISDQVNQAGYPILNGNPGGGPANFAVACAKLSLKTAMITNVGDDIFGRLLIKTLQDYGVDTKHVTIDSEHFTTMAFVNIKPDGDREFSFARKQSADIHLHFDETMLSSFINTRAAHFSSVSMTCQPAYSATINFIKYVKNNGSVIHFDPNYRDRLWSDQSIAIERILQGIELADILKISDYELALLEGLDLENISIESLINRALQFYQSHKHLKLMHLTMGEKGVSVIAKSGHIYHQPNYVKAIDTTGAGDIYGAAALYKYLEYSSDASLNVGDLSAIADFATRAASYSVQRHGGMPSAPSLQDL